MQHANPAFPGLGGASMANMAPSANIGPMAKTSQAPLAAPFAHHQYHHPYPQYGLGTTTGVILVLFILLVIVSRAWAI